MTKAVERKMKRIVRYIGLDLKANIWDCCVLVLMPQWHVLSAIFHLNGNIEEWHPYIRSVGWIPCKALRLKTGTAFTMVATRLSAMRF